METLLLNQQPHLPESTLTEVATQPVSEVLTDHEVETGMAELVAYLDRQVPPEAQEYLRTTPSKKGPPGRDNPNSSFTHS